MRYFVNEFHLYATMKISELPQEIKGKALEYQRNEKGSNYSKTTDCLEDAFNWFYTEEGTNYWDLWDDKECQKDSIVESVRQQLLERSNVGIIKYGVTLDRNDLSLVEWLEHLKQEQMDSVLYIERAIQEIKSTSILKNIDKIDFTFP